MLYHKQLVAACVNKCNTAEVVVDIHFFNKQHKAQHKHPSYQAHPKYRGHESFLQHLSSSWHLQVAHWHQVVSVLCLLFAPHFSLPASLSDRSRRRKSRPRGAALHILTASERNSEGFIIGWGTILSMSDPSPRRYLSGRKYNTRLELLWQYRTGIAFSDRAVGLCDTRLALPALYCTLALYQYLWGNVVIRTRYCV